MAVSSSLPVVNKYLLVDVLSGYCNNLGMLEDASPAVTILTCLWVC